MFDRTFRSVMTTVAVAITLAASPAPAAVLAAGQAFPSVGVHPLAVHVKGTEARRDLLHFSCQDRQIDVSIACRTPQQLRTAYGFDGLLSNGIDGTGRTIIIVDAFDNPYIASDLTLFDAAFGLPDPTLNVYYPDGQTPFDYTDGNMVGWSSEISLDVEWAHAMAPGATIDLVLGKSNQDADLNSATKWAVDHNIGDVISQSFGEAESCASPADVNQLHKIYFEAKKKGITLLASSGDFGADQPSCDGSDLIKSAGWPAIDPLVTGVGGTNVVLTPSSGAYQSERAWSDGPSGCFPTTDFGCSGGGFSDIYGRPSYQNGTANTLAGHRGVPDVSYNAGVDGGVIVHWGVGDTVSGGSPTDPTSFWLFGGTSAGSPQWAALVAGADQYGGHRVGQINNKLYGIAHSKSQYASALHDVTTGNNNYEHTGYDAGKGWDPVTGLGSPNAAKLVPLLAQ